MTRCSFSLQGGFAQKRGRHKKIRQAPSLPSSAALCKAAQVPAAVRAQLTSSLPPLTLHTQTACNPIHFSCTLHFLLSSIYCPSHEASRRCCAADRDAEGFVVLPAVKRTSADLDREFVFNRVVKYNANIQFPTFYLNSASIHIPAT